MRGNQAFSKGTPIRKTNRLVVVSSNDEVEYGFCTERINMADWK